MKSIQKQKIFLLVGIPLLIVVVAYRLLPYMQDAISSESRVFAEQRILSLQKKVLQKQNLERQRLDLNRRLAKYEAKLLQGATSSLSAVTIQNLLYDLAKKDGVKIQSVRVLKATKITALDDDDESLSMYSGISIQVRIDLSIRQLKNIMYGVAKSAKSIRIEVLDIQRLKKSKEGTIRIILTLAGLMVEE